MVKYTIQRLLAGVLTLLVAMIAIFMLVQLMPNSLMDTLVNFGGDDGTGGNFVTQQTVEAIMERFGWDRPLPVQFFNMLQRYLQLDFGISLVLRPNMAVADVMATHLPVTIQLNFFALFLILPAGLFFGITTALLKNSVYDHVASTFVVFFIAAPGFVIAALLQYFIAFRLGWFPVLLAAEETLNWTRFYSMILPILAISFGPIAHMARVMRAELTEALTSEYMLLARAKGQSYRQAIMRHALRNASVPLVGTFVFLIIGLLNGALIVELIFGVPGISRILVSSINSHDYQVALAIIYFYTAISIITAIIVDLSLGIIDPRIRMGGKRSG